MGKKFITATVFVLLVLSLPALFRKRAVPIVANGKVVALGKRPFVMPWRDNEFSVYAKDSKVFSLWGDLFDFPLFIHAFADGKRFLCIDDDDTAVLVFVATTLPQFFLVGVSWPREMIPPLLDYIRRVFPSESAIDGLVRIGQMGASLEEVRADWLYLWLLTAIYFCLAVVAARRRAAIEAANAI